MSSSLVLLNEDGSVDKKLQLVSLPKDYTIPQGKILSWRKEIIITDTHVFPSIWRIGIPIEAHFYLGSAWASVTLADIDLNGNKDYLERRVERMLRGNPSMLTITVQGTSSSDLMALRDHILELINRREDWNVKNDLNPKKPLGFFRFIKSLFTLSLP